MANNLSISRSYREDSWDCDWLVEQMKKAMAAEKKSYQAEIRKNVSENEQRRSQLQVRLEKSETANKTLINENNQLHRTNEEIKVAESATTKKYRILRKSHFELVSSSDKDRSEAQRREEVLRGEIRELQQKEKNISQVTMEQQLKMEKLKKDLEHKVENLTQDLEHAEESKKSLREKIDELKMEVNTNNQTHLKQLKSSIEESCLQKQELEKVKSEKLTTITSLSTTTKELEELRKKEKEAETQTKQSQQELQSCREELQDAEKRASKTGEELSKLNLQLQQTQKDLECARGESAQSRDRIEQMSSHLSEAKHQRDEALQTIRDKESIIAEKGQKEQELGMRVEGLEEQLSYAAEHKRRGHRRRSSAGESTRARARKRPKYIEFGLWTVKRLKNRTSN